MLQEFWLLTMKFPRDATPFTSIAVALNGESPLHVTAMTEPFKMVVPPFHVRLSQAGSLYAALPALNHLLVRTFAAAPDSKREFTILKFVFGRMSTKVRM